MSKLALRGGVRLDVKSSNKTKGALPVVSKLPPRRVVREEGLEPPRREARDPKSRMSTSFITPAQNEKYYNDIFKETLIIRSSFLLQSLAFHFPEIFGFLPFGEEKVRTQTKKHRPS